MVKENIDELLKEPEYKGNIEKVKKELQRQMKLSSNVSLLGNKLFLDKLGGESRLKRI